MEEYLLYGMVLKAGRNHQKKSYEYITLIHLLIYIRRILSKYFVTYNKRIKYIPKINKHINLSTFCFVYKSKYGNKIQ